MDTPNPVRHVHQKRSAATRDRILKVVTTLLDKGTYNDARVQDIVSLADCSVGAFYGRFVNKDAALYALYDNRCAALETDCKQLLRSDDEPLQVMLARYVALIIEHTTRHAPMLQAGKTIAKTKNSAPFTIRSRDMNMLIAKLMADLLARRQSEHMHVESERASMYVIGIVGSLIQSGMAQSGPPVDCADTINDFRTEMAKILHGYLGIG